MQFYKELIGCSFDLLESLGHFAFIKVSFQLETFR
jgi:hypothetical protein